MKILVLSFYYQPDLCAGSFRCTALINELRKHKDVHLKIITTLPNRYSSFSADALGYEVQDNVEIHRVALPSHKSGMLDQIKAFTTFYKEALKLSKNDNFDLVFATSSRLFTAFLGARIASAKKVPLYLDIRDIFVDTIQDVLPTKVSWLAKPLFSLIENYTFRRAKRINLVSKGFYRYFSSKYPGTQLSWFTNGIDNEFLDVAPETASDIAEPTDSVTVLYAGNIGEGQGLHIILPTLAKRLEGRVSFRVIGDGGRKEVLKHSLTNISNVELLPPVGRQELIREYQNADILFLHLNDYPAFRKVLPSKIFEYAALGKPILAGVSGYAADFLQQEVTNSAVFYPGNDGEALMSFEKLTLGVSPRDEFNRKYARQKIMSDMAEDIIKVVTTNV